MDEGSSLWVGQLTFVILVAPVLAAIASLILIWRYQKLTLKGMRMIQGARQHPPKPPANFAPPKSPLAIRFHDEKTLAPTSQAAEAAFQRMDRSLMGSVGIYLAAGVAYAVIVALASLHVSGAGFLFWRFLFLLVACLWPVTVAASLVSGSIKGAFGAYLALFLVVALGTLAASSETTMGQLVLLWFLLNAPGTVFVLLFLHRKLRAIGPMLLVFFTASVAGAIGAFELLRQSGEGGLSRVVEVAYALGLGAEATFWLVLLLGAAVLGLIAKGVWNLMGKCYREKKFSDQMLILDCLWLQFAIIQPLVVIQSGWWTLAGLVGFAAYKLVTLLGFSVLNRRFPPAEPPPTLLLLRVFALGHQSERFFKIFGRWWLRWGSIRLIAGPDLVAATVSPHEFLEFVAGRHLDRFVKSDEDLAARSQKLDDAIDPDGIYRVSEFFCHADTWQRTMRNLAKNSQAILMDLRSFTASNQGCTYELEQLLDHVDLDRVALVIDETTDRDFLQKTLQDLWGKLLPDSPNHQVADPMIHVFHARKQDRATMRALLLMLGGTQKIS